MIVQPKPTSSHRCCLLTLFLLIHASRGDKCSVCQNGEDVPLPDKVFQVNGIPIQDCGSLDIAASFLTKETPFCNSIEAIGTLCGCSYSETACTLCSDGERVTYPTEEIRMPEYLAKNFLSGAPDDVYLNCETLEAILHNHEQDSSTCLIHQHKVSHSVCGCVAPQAQNSSTDSSENTTSTDLTQQGGEEGKGELEDDLLLLPETEFSICSLCLDGQPITTPDRPLDLADHFPVSNCQDLVNFAALLKADSAECEAMQYIGTYCGCEAKRNSCTFCSDGSPVKYPEKPLVWYKDYLKLIPDEFRAVGESLTCGMFEAILQTVPDGVFGIDTDLLCIASRFKSGICGCDYGWEPILLTWCYRVSGILSFIGSFFILLDVLLSSRKRNATYHQIVVGISSYDVISSIAYVLCNLMVPVDSGLYQAHGNQLTCAVQGFMIQLGLTSVVYNAILSVYFLFIIQYNWREHQFQKYRHYVHLIINIAGWILAFGALPLYDAQLGVCYVVQPPVAYNWIPIATFYTIPVALALATITITTLVVCRKVYHHQVTMEWNEKTQVLSKRVFWQSFWYVLCFLLTLPFLLVSYYLQFQTYDHYIIFVAVGLLAPIQGALNALVYFNRNRKFDGWCSCCQRISNVVRCCSFSCKKASPETYTEFASTQERKVEIDSIYQDKVKSVSYCVRSASRSSQSADWGVAALSWASVKPVSNHSEIPTPRSMSYCMNNLPESEIIEDEPRDETEEGTAIFEFLELTSDEPDRIDRILARSRRDSAAVEKVSESSLSVIHSGHLHGVTMISTLSQ